MEKTNINLIPMKSHINLILLLLVFEIAGLNAQTYFDIEFAGANNKS
jgi:hypothetical protein